MKNKGIIAENHLAKELGGRTVAQSGSGINKGDVSAGRFLIQCKMTDKKSFTLKLSDLEKCFEESMFENKEPLFCVIFGNKKYWILWDYQIGELLDE